MPAATSSTIPAMVQALLQKFEAITAANGWPGQIGQPALLGSGEPVQIGDGMPTSNIPDNMVVVGGDSLPTGEGTQTWAGLGAQYRYERYEIPCWVSCYVGGGSAFADTETASDAQLSARTNAFNIMAVIEQALYTDLQLLSVTNPPNILWCEITKIANEQTDPNASGADKGRWVNINFTVDVHGRIRG